LFALLFDRRRSLRIPIPMVAPRSVLFQQFRIVSLFLLIMHFISAYFTLYPNLLYSLIVTIFTTKIMVSRKTFLNPFSTSGTVFWVPICHRKKLKKCWLKRKQEDFQEKLRMMTLIVKRM